MPSNEALVPVGGEHGDRKKIESAMKVAGMPAAVPQGSPAGGVPPSPPPSAPGGGSPAPSQDLSGWDVFSGRDPSGVLPQPGQPDRVSLFRSRLEQSPNSALRYYFGRTDEFLE